MGSIANRILGTLLSVVLAVSFVPAAAFGDTGSQVTGQARIGMTQDELDASVETDQITGVAQVTGSTSVNIIGSEELKPNVLAVYRVSPALSVTSLGDAADKTVWVDIVYGSALEKDDKSAYEITWTRTIGARGSESAPEVVASTGEVGGSGSGESRINTDRISVQSFAADEAQGLLAHERISYKLEDIIDDPALNDTTLNYYVKVTDTGAAADEAAGGAAGGEGEENANSFPTASNFVDRNSNQNKPAKVNTGEIAEMYKGDPLYWPSGVLPPAAPIIMVEGNNSAADDPMTDPDWNGVDGGIHRDATLSVEQLDTTEKQQASASYQALLQDELEAERVIVGETTTGSGESAVTATGTAAWHLALADVPEGSDAFKDTILVSLNLNNTLKQIGLNALPDNFPDGYQLRHAGGSGITIDKIVFEKDGDGNPTGIVSFEVKRAPGVAAGTPTPGDMGVIALVRDIDPAVDHTYTITTQVAQGAGRITPIDEMTYVVGGTAPVYTFLPDDGYRILKVQLFYDDSEAGGLIEGHPSPIEIGGFDGTMRNSLTLDNSITGSTWERDAKLVVSFGTIADVPVQPGQTTFGVTVSSIEGSGSVTIGDTTISSSALGSSGATVQLAANEAHDIKFNASFGYRLASLSVSADGTAGSWTPVSVAGSTYRISKLTGPLWFSVKFVDGVVDEKPKHVVSAVVLSGGATGSAYFAAETSGGANPTSKEVLDGEGATVMIVPAKGYKLATAQAYYVDKNGVESGGDDLMGRYEAPSGGSGIGMISLSNIISETIVRVTFAKIESGETPGPGQVVTPEKGTVKVSGIKAIASDGSVIDLASAAYGATSVPAKGKGVEVPIGSKQTFAYYYDGSVNGSGGLVDGNGKPLYWVIDYLEVTYPGSSQAQKLAVTGGVNYVTLTVTSDMQVVAVLRAPEAGDGQTVGPDDNNTVTGGGAIEGEDGKPVGGMTDPDSGEWIPGGSVQPSGGTPVVPGTSQTVTIEPDPQAPEDGKHWEIGEVVVDGTKVWPVEGEPGEDGKIEIKDDDGKTVMVHDPDTGVYEFVDEAGNPTGEKFTYDPSTGVMTFDPVESGHDVKASFELVEDEPDKPGPDGPVIVPDNPGVVVTPPGVTVDPDTGEVKVPGPGGGTVSIGKDEDGKYVNPTDPTTGRPMTNPDNTQFVVDPATGNVVETELPYVDSNGTIIGEGGAYDPEADVWNAGGTVTGGAGGSGHVVAGRGDQVVTVRPSDTAEETVHDWMIDEIAVDGVTVWPVEGEVAADGTVTMTGSDGTKVVYNPKTDAYTGTLPNGDTFGFELDDRTGKLTFNSPQEDHRVQASFERFVGVGDEEAGIDVEMVSQHGQSNAGGHKWKLYKTDEKYRVTIAPEKDYEISSFTVNGVSRISDLASDVTSAEYAAMVAAAKDESTKSAESRSSLAKLFGVQDAYAYGTSGELAGIDDARSYTLDLKRDYLDTLAKASERSAGNSKVRMLVDFAKKGTYTVTAFVASGEGTVNGAQRVSIPVQPGGSCTLNLAAGEGYHVANVSDSGVNGGAMQAWSATTYSVTSVTDNRTVMVYFAPDDPLAVGNFTITARVVGGSGTVEGKQTASVVVPKGGYYDLSFAPAAGYQVVRVTDSGANGGQPQTWTSNTYRVGDVTSDRTVEVYFAMVGAPGSNTDAAKTLRRISSMLRTGDGMLPMVFCALGVGLGAAGIAVLLANSRRDGSRRRDD